MPIEAGAYDPVKAQIKQQVTQFIYSEPIQSVSVYCETYIRFPYPQINGWEQQVQGQAKSTGIIIIRCRRNSKTIRIDPSMEIHHNGQIYGILTKQPVPSRERDEIEFRCQYLTASAFVGV